GPAIGRERWNVVFANVGNSLLRLRVAGVDDKKAARRRNQQRFTIRKPLHAARVYAAVLPIERTAAIFRLNLVPLFRELVRIEPLGLVSRCDIVEPNPTVLFIRKCLS